MPQDPYKIRLDDLSKREQQVFRAEPIPHGWIALPMQANLFSTMIHAVGLGILGFMAGTGITSIVASYDIIGRNLEFLRKGDYFALTLGSVLILGFVVITVLLVRGSITGFVIHADNRRQRDALAKGRMVAGMVLTESHAMLREAGDELVLKVPRREVKEAMIIKRMEPDQSSGGGSVLAPVSYLRFHWANRSREIRLLDIVGEPVEAINGWRLSGSDVPQS